MRGPLTSLFGPAHPLGIDVGVPTGTPIVAALDGVVVFAGGQPCCSYGYYVDVDHGNGYLTRYGHLNTWPAVRTGQRVEQGDYLGPAGSTGYSTGPHLHFEIRRGGVPINPLSLLP